MVRARVDEKPVEVAQVEAFVDEMVEVTRLEKASDGEVGTMESFEGA